MRKSFLVFSLLCTVVLLSFAVKPANADIVFQLSNESGRTFTEIWVGPSSNGKWLTRDKFVNSNGRPTTLRSGYHMDLWPNMSGRQDVQYWDIRVVTPDGKKHEWYNIDLVNIYQVEIDRSYTAHFAR